MTHKTSTLKNSFQFSLQPAPAWTAIIGLAFFTVVCVLIGAGKILNLAFPAGAVAVGVLLYTRYPILYIGFNWWIWFLTPLIRRLADYRSGFTEPSPILLSPYLVTLITLITLWHHLPKSYRQDGLPFILCLSSLCYGFAIGILQNSPVKAVISFLDWVVPVLFSFHLFVNWQSYPSYRQNIQRTFLWGVLIMSIYGILQYVLVPEWDRFWVINSGMASAGLPAPFKLNIHSTLNDRGTFSVFLMAGLLLLFSSKSLLVAPGYATGYLAILLTRVRTSWIAWLLGLLTHSASLKSSLQMRLMITVLLAAVCVIPLTTMEPFANRIGDRVESFSNLEKDDSFQARSSMYDELLDSALTNVVGQGIGAGTADSGILTNILQLGWIGVLFYWGGIILMLFRLFQGSSFRFDLFASTSRGIVVSTISILPIGNPLAGTDSMIFWGFLGMGLAANTYYRNTQNPSLQTRA